MQKNMPSAAPRMSGIIEILLSRQKPDTILTVNEQGDYIKAIGFFQLHRGIFIRNILSDRSSVLPDRGRTEV
jgi:hypothetical protein